MTYEDFLEDEMRNLPHSFRTAIKNGTTDDSPEIMKYLVERIAFVRWEAQEKLKSDYYMYSKQNTIRKKELKMDNKTAFAIDGVQLSLNNTGDKLISLGKQLKDLNICLAISGQQETIENILDVIKNTKDQAEYLEICRKTLNELYKDYRTK